MFVYARKIVRKMQKKFNTSGRNAVGKEAPVFHFLPFKTFSNFLNNIIHYS